MRSSKAADDGKHDAVYLRVSGRGPQPSLRPGNRSVRAHRPKDTQKPIETRSVT
jgi:hypothetical protein